MTQPRIHLTNLGAWSLCLALIVAGCSSRAAKENDGAQHDATISDALAIADINTNTTDGARIDAAVIGDATIDAKIGDAAPVDLRLADATLPTDGAVTQCASYHVWSANTCAPAYLQGCNMPCDPTDPKSCAAGQECVACAATSCPNCRDCRPSCVYTKPASTFGPGELWISPTQGTANTPVTLTVRGGMFHNGALFWWIRIVGEAAVQLTTGSDCKATATLTPKTAGVHAVEVAYGGTPPTQKSAWSLAGYFVTGAPQPGLLQPGGACSKVTDPCAKGDGYSCVCLSGRCECLVSP